MKKYQYGADMGSIKIMSKCMSCFFDNEVGDGEYDVIVLEENEKKDFVRDLKFKGHFTIRTEAYLMCYDCSDFVYSDKLHKFEKGRHFVYLDKKTTTFYIQKVDNETHS